MNRKLYKTKDWLYDQYWILNKSQILIAKECKTSKNVISYQMRKLNIPTRSASEAGKISFEMGRSVSHLTKENRYKITGKNNHLWTGENGSDETKRSYVRSHNEKYKYCEFCGRGNCKISFCFDHYKGKHTRNIKNYKQLCDKCHFNRDYYEFGIHTKTNNHKSNFNLVCECGVNFKDLDEAKKMILESKKINAFATKFQIYSKDQIKDSKNYDFLKSIMLDYDNIKELYQYGKKIKQEVFFSCMFEESIDWCNSLNIKYGKIRFFDKNNYSLLWKAFLSGNKYFISTNYFIPFRTNFIPLFCIPKYPSSIKDYILPNNIFYQGISDHTKDIILLEKTIKEKRLNYFEKHVKLSGTTPIENDWSITFKELEEVLKRSKL